MKPFLQIKDEIIFSIPHKNLEKVINDTKQLVHKRNLKYQKIISLEKRIKTSKKDELAGIILLEDSRKIENDITIELIDFLKSIKIEDSFHYSSFIDSRDNQKYKTIELFDKVWFAENLNYNPRNNLCHIGSKIIKGEDTYFGLAYDWDISMEKACPKGWRIPTREDWIELLIFFGGYYERGKGNLGNPDLAYHQLIEQKDSNIELKLGGINRYGKEFLMMGVIGNYWTSSKKTEHSIYTVNFSKSERLVKIDDKYKSVFLYCICVKEKNKY